MENDSTCTGREMSRASELGIGKKNPCSGAYRKLLGISIFFFPLEIKFKVTFK